MRKRPFTIAKMTALIVLSTVVFSLLTFVPSNSKVPDVPPLIERVSENNVEATIATAYSRGFRLVNSIPVVKQGNTTHVILVFLK